MMVQDAVSEVAARPINALILDDDDFDRRRICRMGAASGLEMNVISAPTIQEMRSHLDDHVFDLIFLDYRLSNETGLEALEHIQSHQTNAQAAKIMLTGHLKLEIAVAALKSGCHDYVSKDALNPGLLRQTVETVLAKSRQRVITPQVPEEMLDRAVLDLATTRLPGLLAQVLASPDVQEVLTPLLHGAIQQGLEHGLRRFELPESAYADPQVGSLLTSLSDDHQIRLND